VDFSEFLALFESIGISDPTIGLALVVIASLMIFIVIIVPILKPVILDIAPYAYPNARIRAMESKLISKTKLEELLEVSSVVDVVGHLEGTDYEAQLAKLKGSAEDASSVETALYESQKSAYHNIMTVAPDVVRGIFVARLKIYEVKLLKAVLRSLHAGVPVQQTLAGTSDMGTGIDIEAFYNLQSTEEFISKIEDTEYGEVLSDAVATYSEKKNIQPIEMALDRFAYEKLWNTIRTVSEQNIKALKFFFGTEVDAINIRTLMRAKADGLTPDDIKDYVLPMGYELDSDTLNALADVPDVQGMISVLEGKTCGEALSEALSEYESQKSIVPLEVALEAHVAKIGRKVSMSQPFGIGPFVGYLCSKDVEVRNLRAILRGIEAKMPKEITKNILIMV